MIGYIKARSDFGHSHGPLRTIGMLVFAPVTWFSIFIFPYLKKRKNVKTISPQN